MFKNILKVVTRNIRLNPGYSLMNILGLAIGMAVCIAIFLWVQDEITFDKFHKNAGRIYRVVSKIDDQWITSSPWAISEVLKKDFQEISGATRYTEYNRLVRYKDVQAEGRCALVDRDFFDVFTFPFAEGDAQSAFPVVHSTVVTEEAAVKYFGSDDPVGKIIKVNNQFDLTITGVIKKVPANSSLNFEFLVNINIIPSEVLQSWAIETDTYVMLQDNADVDDLRIKMSGTTAKYDKRIMKAVINDLEPLTRMHLYSLRGSDPVIYVYMFSAIAVFILILACINFINLTTARAGKRCKEIGIRKVSGANRSDIMIQFLAESMTQTLIAGILAVFAVMALLPEFNSLSGKKLEMDVFNNWALLITLLGIVLITGLLSGGYPALVISAFQPIKVFRGTASAASSRSMLRRTLVTFQFVVAITLTIGTWIVYDQITYIQKKDLGYNREQIVTLRMSDELLNKYESFKNEILGNTNILSVTRANNAPTNVGNINPVYWEGRGPDQYEMMNFICTDRDYIETFRMEIVQGRNFSRELATDSQNYIVNEEAVKFMQMDHPVGKLFSIWQNEGRIVGVVKNFHASPLRDPIKPVAITLLPNWTPRRLFIKIRPENLHETIDYMKKVWMKYTPNHPFDYWFLDDIFNRYYQSEMQMSRLFRYFAALTIFISCLGLLGLVSFMAEQKTKEIGIRKALGATVGNMVYLLSKEFILLIATANVIAWPLAYFAMNHWLQGFAYHTEPGIILYVFSALLVFLIAIITVSYQAIKAARANPVESLRYE